MKSLFFSLPILLLALVGCEEEAAPPPPPAVPAAPKTTIPIRCALGRPASQLDLEAGRQAVAYWKLARVGNSDGYYICQTDSQGKAKRLYELRNVTVEVEPEGASGGGWRGWARVSYLEVKSYSAAAKDTTWSESLTQEEARSAANDSSSSQHGKVEPARLHLEKTGANWRIDATLDGATVAFKKAERADFPSATASTGQPDTALPAGASQSQKEDAEHKAVFLAMIKAVDQYGMGEACERQWGKIAREHHIDGETALRILDEGLDQKNWRQPATDHYNAEKKFHRVDWIRKRTELKAEPMTPKM
jgi:hypothetical protein